MTDPLETQPVTVEYAAAASQVTAPRSPAGAFRAATISLIVALSAGCLLLFAAGRVFNIASSIGFLASITAFLCAGAACLQNRNFPRQSPLRLSRSRCIPVIVAAFVLLQFNGWNCAQTGNRIRELDRSNVTLTQLRGIAAATNQYRQEHSTGPDSLDTLVRAGLLTQKQLWLLTDPTPQQPGSPGFVPSCVFLPDAATTNAHPSAILAYERGPWSTEGMRMSLFPLRLHSIVYANGTTARLAPADLAAALAKTPATQPRP